MVPPHFKTPFRFVLFVLKPFRFHVLVMLFVALTWSVCTSLMPYCLKLMIDRASLDVDAQWLERVVQPACLYILIAVCTSLMFRLYDYVIPIRMIPALRTHIVMTAYERLLKQSHSFYQNNFAGSLMNRVSDLSGSVPELLQIAIDRFLFTALVLSIATFTLWQVNVRFALMFSVWIGFYACIVAWRIKYIRYFSSSWSGMGSVLNGNLVDVFGNMFAVRLFNRQRAELDTHREKAQKAIFLERKLHWNYAIIWACYASSYLLLQALLLYFLIKGRQAGFVSVGDFALVIALCSAVAEHLWMLAREFSNFSKYVGRIDQGIEVLRQSLEVKDAKDAQDLAVSRGEICFDHVHFHYKENAALFDNKSVLLMPGSKVGLVGYSGSGKTTFANLIVRLYDLQSGEIRIDGQNIAHVTLETLHAAIGMIPQEPSLFHRSLYDNIACAKEGATKEEVLAASIKAKAHEFIVQIPQGYDALVGERGVKLSGGQRQRIAIARAILKNAPILIIDEATSQLDSLIENAIQDNLWELMQDKTTIVIAHRLSTLLRMDRILVFDRGTIVQDGTHATLLAQEGLYKELWNAQVGGFLPEANNQA